mgnify:CR=1 FL=1
MTKEVLLGLKDSAFYHYFINASDEQLILKYGFTRAVLNDLFEVLFVANFFRIEILLETNSVYLIKAIAF